MAFVFFWGVLLMIGAAFSRAEPAPAAEDRLVPDGAAARLVVVELEEMAPRRGGCGPVFPGLPGPW